MTKATDEQQVDKIARSLNRYEWDPTQEEISVGDAFLRELQKDDEASRPFPRGPQEWDRLRTEGMVGLVAKVARIDKILLPLWRERLPSDSPMIALLEIYVRGAQPILHHAEDVLAAWRGAVWRGPTQEEIAYEARRLQASPEEARTIWRFEEARDWESQPSRSALWEELLPKWSYLTSVASVVAAAVTGDVEY
ncbi:hypothetical protein J2Z21_008458 [Streptomyces griseochromogenes]|uniref:Uncharacterized protein n=1 Tax=Streptomyces griseochromogenes TaxID=68214 RepID=A0A1B1B482_9ACTN|nr:hypothetical protein [Streptomyces griseochromogenes]ANP53628.1 hypothetical protein AVL59_32440 [Streptomyces griseochromogenes]MBP2055444.1 hypothetical protein [Streptomyces griseochromogenes]